MLLGNLGALHDLLIGRYYQFLRVQLLHTIPHTFIHSPVAYIVEHRRTSHFNCTIESLATTLVDFVHAAARTSARFGAPLRIVLDTISTLFITLHSAFDEALDNTSRGKIIIFQNHLSIMYDGVWLYKELSGLHEGGNWHQKMEKELLRSHTIFFLRTTSRMSLSQPGNGVVNCV